MKLDRAKFGDVFVVVAQRTRDSSVQSYLGDKQATMQEYDFVGLKRAFLFRSLRAAQSAARGMAWAAPDNCELVVLPINIAFT